MINPFKKLYELSYVVTGLTVINLIVLYGLVIFSIDEFKEHDNEN